MLVAYRSFITIASVPKTLIGIQQIRSTWSSLASLKKTDMSHTCKQKLLKNYHPPSLTALPWRMMVGRRSGFLLGFGYFSGANSWTSDRYLVWKLVTFQVSPSSRCSFQRFGTSTLSSASEKGFSAKNPRPWNQIPPLDVSFIRVCRFITWNDPKKMGETFKKSPRGKSYLPIF